ncbi:ankyrin repeat and LEM domain-containing protein 1 [Sitophilus oryzae]|uniref:Ankyrin repeat and LEM domain-containing protein 1 n=1 Tax=Sitophilus oryzae TaxID=7048 RepID=A0A6J2XBA7_SITOR|nr:ankyrin repeat and LEM domain-containing protein 1 [Sitophilus oryzae]
MVQRKLENKFTYFLRDPRVTSNLPSRVDNLSPEKIWETFLSAIFYVGKGKRSRPYQHLYDAVQLWKTQESPSSKKIAVLFVYLFFKHVWNDGGGVICLHVFLNNIPVEAYTREAVMIGALGLENLTNAKGGEFYGVAAIWMSRQKRMLGVYLLYRAMGIFLNEGERQLYPEDIN